MHLRESQHHVDDQRIAEEAHDAHDGVENLVDQRNDRQIGLAVLDRRVLLARYQRVIDARGAHHGRARYRAVHLDRRFIDTDFFLEKKFLLFINFLEIFARI